MKRFDWTPERERVLRALYPHHTAAQAAQALGCGVRAVYNKVHAMGLTKAPEFMARQQSGRMARGQQHPRSVATQFKPGQKPWNTGLKGWQAGGRAPETQFKPGQKPRNTLPVGSLRLNPCHQTGRLVLEQKTGEAKGPNHLRWTPVARLVWEAAHGPLPHNHIVVFKPGLFTNVREEITLERLECITRAEHAMRNHPRSKNPELGKLVQLKGAITRQVNRINREHAEQQGTAK